MGWYLASYVIYIHNMSTKNVIKDNYELQGMAQRRAGGDTIRNIAAQVGKSPSAVCRALQSSDAKEIIERESQRLLEALPDITASSIAQIKTSQQIHNAIQGATDQDGNKATIP